MPNYRVLLKYTYLTEASDEQSAVAAIGAYVRAQDTFDSEAARSVLLSGQVQPEAAEIEVMGEARSGETHPWDVGLRIEPAEDGPG